MGKSILDQRDWALSAIAAVIETRKFVAGQLKAESWPAEMEEAWLAGKATGEEKDILIDKLRACVSIWTRDGMATVAMLRKAVEKIGIPDPPLAKGVDDGKDEGTPSL